MSDASLNDVYKLVGELNGTAKSMVARMDKADESRTKMHARMDQMAEREARIEGDVKALGTRVGSIEAKVDAQQAITDVVKTARDHAVVAGRLGMILWKIGRFLLAAAAGAATYWYSMTGKPPP